MGIVIINIINITIAKGSIISILYLHSGTYLQNILMIAIGSQLTQMQNQLLRN